MILKVKLMGFFKRLDIGCQFEREINNDLRVWGLSQMELIFEMGKIVGGIGLWKYFGDNIWIC